jgi:hypothetical protein
MHVTKVYPVMIISPWIEKLMSPERGTKDPYLSDQPFM